MSTIGDLKSFKYSIIYYGTAKSVRKDFGKDFRVRAHHMAPSKGKLGNASGVHHGTFHFKMAGEWVIGIRTAAPSRAQMQHAIKVHKKGESSEHKNHMK